MTMTHGAVQDAVLRSWLERGGGEGGSREDTMGQCDGGVVRGKKVRKTRDSGGEGSVSVQGQSAVPGLPAGLCQLQGQEGCRSRERRLVNYIQKPFIRTKSVIFFFT